MKVDELRKELNEFLTFVHQKDLGVMSKKEIIDNYLTESKVNELNKSDVSGSLPLSKIIGQDNPFPLVNILDRLAKGCEYLLHRNNYDGSDYEEIQICVHRAKETIKLLRQ